VEHYRRELNLNEAAATDFQGFAGRQTKDPLAASLADLNQAQAQPYETLRAAHVADYQKYFHRAALELPSENSNLAELPTPKRIQLAQQENDTDLAALYFHFGRYLLISSSRPGGLPPNLQGIWAEEIHTPWTGGRAHMVPWHSSTKLQRRGRDGEVPRRENRAFAPGSWPGSPCASRLTCLCHPMRSW
jgi:alpha-L-fucosidase 2